MWWRRKRPEPRECPDARQRIEEAKAAREVSEENLERVRQRWPEVNEVTRSLRRERERNRFAERFAQAMGDREGHGRPA